MYSPSTSRTFRGLELVGHVEIGPDPLDMEPLDAGVEVDEAHGHAGDADDRQAGAAHSSRISRRSLTSMSSGSAKMSIASKPSSLVLAMPNAVPRPAWTQAELMSPSFMVRALRKMRSGDDRDGLGGSRLVRRAVIDGG